MNKEEHKQFCIEEEGKKKVRETDSVAYHQTSPASPQALGSGTAMEENGRCCQTHIIQ